MKIQKIIVRTLLLLSFQFTIFPTLAQSSAESAAAIGRELATLRNSIVTILNSAQTNPEELLDGKTKIDLTKIQPELVSIYQQISDTLDLVSQKESKLNSLSGLGEKEVWELKEALKSQRIPLENDLKTASKLQTDLQMLIDSKIPELATVYKSFKDIAGKEKAKEKVQERMETVLAYYLPPKPKPKPTETPRPSPSATSKPTNPQQTSSVEPQVKKTSSSASKKASIPLWGPKDKLPKDVKGHRLAGQFAIQGSTVDAEVILVPAQDADKPFARQFWVVNRRFSGGPSAHVPIGKREIISISKNKPMIFIGRGILPGIYNVEMQ